MILNWVKEGDKRKKKIIFKDYEALAVLIACFVLKGRNMKLYCFANKLHKV